MTRVVAVLEYRDVWQYVVSGYALVALTIGGYVVWLQRKLARAKRSSPEDVV